MNNNVQFFKPTKSTTMNKEKRTYEVLSKLHRRLHYFMLATYAKDVTKNELPKHSSVHTPEQMNTNGDGWRVCLEVKYEIKAGSLTESIQRFLQEEDCEIVQNDIYGIYFRKNSCEFVLKSGNLTSDWYSKQDRAGSRFLSVHITCFTLIEYGSGRFVNLEGLEKLWGADYKPEECVLYEPEQICRDEKKLQHYKKWGF